AGTVVAQAGMPIERRVLVLASGKMVQTRHGEQIGEVEPGDFWNEFQLLERSRRTGAVHKVSTSFSCKSNVIEWETSVLSEYLINRPELRQKLQELWAEGLNLKLDRRNAHANERAYVDILRGILCKGVVGETEFAFLKHVRKVHDIPEHCHVDALHELGYTEPEFVALVAKSRRPWWLRWLNLEGRVTFS
ncbi:unnamed protein product, partial [Polarella glacialis]